MCGTKLPSDSDRVTDPAGNWASYSYDSAGRRIGVNNSNGTLATYTYDTAGRLTAMTTNGPSGAISSYQYTYDKVGNRLSVNEAGSNSTTYSYDKLYRLTAYDETRPDASKGTFSYDAAGNRTNMILAKKYLPNDSRSFTYSYNQANQLVDIMQKGRQSPIETTFSYDKNGSLVTRAVTQGKTTTTTSYLYDYLNRLSQVATPDGKTVTIENLADGFNRLSKTTDNGTTNYFHDGMSVLGEYDATGTRTARYTLGTGTDEIIAREDATGTYFYHYDGLGSVAAVTDNTGKVVAKYDYEPFGRMKEASTSTINNAYSFTGREWDKETGLYYYRARYYDPMDGRFISRDPSGFNGGINLYNYVGANPVNYTDPRGEIGTVPAVVAGGVIVATAWLYTTNESFRTWADYVIGVIVPDSGVNSVGGIVMDKDRFASVVSMAVNRYNLQIITNGCDSTIDQGWAQQHPYEAWMTLQFATKENTCCSKR